MLGRLRPYIRPVSLLAARPVVALGIPPNVVSLSALPLAVAAAVCLARHMLGPGFVLALLAGLVDLLDGAVAELAGRKTLFGNYLETMIDRMVEVVLYAGLSAGYPHAALAALAASLLVSYAKARVALVIVADNHDWPVIGERAERMTLLLTGLFVAACGLRPFGVDPIAATLWIQAAVCTVGTLQRIGYARRLIEEAERRGDVLPYLKK